MNIIIAGMGEVGRHVAKFLSHTRHHLTLIDLSREALERVGGEVDAMTLKGHAANESTLLQAGIQHCDLFMAVTNRDEVNFIAAIRAKSMGAKKTIARATDPVYFSEEWGLYSDMFGIDLVINPKFLVALEIHRLIRTHGAMAIEDFAHNQIEMIQLPIREDSKVIERTVEDIRKHLLPKDILLVSIQRRGELIIPHGGDILMPNDDVLFIGPIDAMPKVEKAFGFDRDRWTRKVIIVGGGDIGTSLAKHLLSDGIKVIIIEKDLGRCEELSEMLPHASILHGHGSDSLLLEDIGVAYSDVFVTVSHEDELNLLASLLAKELGAPRCIALMHKPDYSQVLQRLGIDATLSPRRMVAQEVLKYVRQGKVLSVNPVMNDQGIFIEYEIQEGAYVTQYALKDLNWPKGALICAVFGEDHAFIPNGDTVIQPGQRILVFTTPKNQNRLNRYF